MQAPLGLWKEHMTPAAMEHLQFTALVMCLDRQIRDLTQDHPPCKSSVLQLTVQSTYRGTGSCLFWSNSDNAKRVGLITFRVFPVITHPEPPQCGLLFKNKRLSPYAYRKAKKSGQHKRNLYICMGSSGRKEQSAADKKGTETSAISQPLPYNIYYNVLDYITTLVTHPSHGTSSTHGFKNKWHNDSDSCHQTSEVKDLAVMKTQAALLLFGRVASSPWKYPFLCFEARLYHKPKQERLQQLLNADSLPSQPRGAEVVKAGTETTPQQPPPASHNEGEGFSLRAGLLNAIILFIHLFWDCSWPQALSAAAMHFGASCGRTATTTMEGGGLHRRKVAKRQGLAGDSKVRISIVCPVSPNLNSNYPLLSEYENMLVLWERLRSESARSEMGRLKHKLMGDKERIPERKPEMKAVEITFIFDTSAFSHKASRAVPQQNYCWVQQSRVRRPRVTSVLSSTNEVFRCSTACSSNKSRGPTTRLNPAYLCARTNCSSWPLLRFIEHDPAAVLKDDHAASVSTTATDVLGMKDLNTVFPELHRVIPQSCNAQNTAKKLAQDGLRLDIFAVLGLLGDHEHCRATLHPNHGVPRIPACRAHDLQEAQCQPPSKQSLLDACLYKHSCRYLCCHHTITRDELSLTTGAATLVPLCLASALAAAVLPALSLAQDQPSPRAFQHHPAPTHPAAGPVGFLLIGPVVEVTEGEEAFFSSPRDLDHRKGQANRVTITTGLEAGQRLRSKLSGAAAGSPEPSAELGLCESGGVLLQSWVGGGVRGLHTPKQAPNDELESRPWQDLVLDTLAHTTLRRCLQKLAFKARLLEEPKAYLGSKRGLLMEAHSYDGILQYLGLAASIVK
ncbi:hypothetical protein Anapl_05296 [Anas platyrhynchos]|uniref:Uncharacterized protein n=1 Tax=Anas platyrhynchos TaxID=8839 RepID=R0KFF3_ANAPL|nr:hypothetical protein Anapl_05296 [Anas platyrhynchos]